MMEGGWLSCTGARLWRGGRTVNETSLAHPDPQRLTAFHSGQPGPAEGPEVERHLAGCPACAAALQGLPGETGGSQR
jgi:hypothetical protein